MAGLGGLINNIGNAMNMTMGKKNSYLKGDKNSGTVGDVVTEQETTNQLLQDIKDSLESLGGNGDGLFSEIDSSSGGLTSDAIKSGVSNAIEKNGNLKEISSNISSFTDNSSSMMDSMKGMSGSMDSGVGALQIINKVLETIRGTLALVNDTVQQGIEKSLTAQKQYLGPISSRLQSFNESTQQDFKSISKEVRNVFTNSRFIDQQKMLQNLNALVKEGVGYNLEDRAYLATIADKTVATFEIINNSTLHRMERLQQADLTRPQMGLEGYLTKGLNAVFQDTSYLNQMYDTVTSALLEATSQMSYEETTGYLYNVQKWLGSLYSVGMSESAIQTIAQGLNYLGSGNVSQLTGNDQLNTLFAMAAQRAGLSYAQLLTTGVSDENVDKLLRSIIEYLQSIAENTSSEVLRNEYGRVFGGLSVSDIRAIQNLTETDIAYIDAYKLSYEDAFKEATKQIQEVENRTTIAEQVENMFNNIIYSLGSVIAEDETSYTNWVKASVVEQLGDMVGGVFPGMIGNLISSGVGAAMEGAKTGEIAKAIKQLEMFQGSPVEALLNEEVENRMAALEDAKQNGSTWDFWIAEQQMTAVPAMEYAETVSEVTQGIAMWDEWSRRGFTGDDTPFKNWKQGTSRLGTYSSSIALAENAFAESEAKIKAASEEVSGIDDTLTRSLDSLYDGLFGDAARPIKVMVVDVDGNLLGSTTTNQYSSNFDVEQNYGSDLINILLPNARAQE